MNKISLLFFCCWFTLNASGYSLRQLSNKSGLSNSAILSICQEQNGMIWIGSCDGLNVFNGNSIQEYAPMNKDQRLSGNLINRIIETEENILWIQTNYGLDRLDTRQNTILSFKEFKDKNRLAGSRDNDLFVLKDDGYLYYYQKETKSFEKLSIPKIDFTHVLEMTIDEANVLWVFSSSNNDNRSYQIKKNGKSTKLTPFTPSKDRLELRYAFSDGTQAFLIDKTNALYEYNFQNQRLYYITNLKPEIAAHGEVSSIIKSQNDYYVGFKTSGLIKVGYLPNQKNKYGTQSTDIQSGIFCLVKDKHQDIIWVGTGGQGVYMCFNDAFTLTNTTLDTPMYQIYHPVRALFYDAESTLWIGTKGGRILRFPKYKPHSQQPASFERMCIDNPTSADNTVYNFAPSRWKRLWIGTESGMSYYSYPEKRIRNFPMVASGIPVRYIHSINEINDSTLWIATVGEGIVKVILNTSGEAPTVKATRRIVQDGGRMASNYFFTSYQENDSIVWFGNRGYGAYRLNTQTEEMKSYQIDQAAVSQSANDVFSIHKTSQGYWFGTGSGLIQYQAGNYQPHNDTNLLPNNTIHGILEDQEKNLWLSTNKGLIRFNPLRNSYQAYQQKEMLAVREFSDGAFFKDPRTNTLFFGGTNGFVTISANEYKTESYTPVIQFTKLSVFGTECNIYDFLETSAKQEKLTLNYSQTFFCIAFNAIDHIHGNNYTYSYKIEELSDHWIKNGNSNQAIFSNLAPGKYTLLVKYKNNTTGQESEPKSLNIVITPPWYMTYWAYAGYILCVLFLMSWSGCWIFKRYRRKQAAIIDRLDLQKQEELYESKLRFFTNITHEFCTPLTLIYGPCEKILSQKNLDQQVKKYGQLILQNAQKLNALILELIEFRRSETGYKQLRVTRFSASEQVQELANSFSELAESRNINYQLKIAQGIDWNSDLSCLNKIVNNLISNAFKYSLNNGVITVELNMEENQLYIRVSNSGKGMKQEDIGKIFDRYKVLDNFEASSVYSRSGLGLAICHSMTKLLSGDIQVSSVPDEITTFTVTLPELPLTEQLAEYLPDSPSHALTQQVSIPVPSSPNRELPPSSSNPNKLTVMVIDDDDAMLWFVSELFSETYNVLSFSNAQQALEHLTIEQPDLIISDVMMPDIDGITFAQKVKENPLWSHIPLILLSARQQPDEQVKGIEAGAEAYVTKPFDVEYLKKIAWRLIQRKEDLKKYYASVASSFQLDDGHLVHKEDQIFFDQMMKTIDDNLFNPNLSVEMLSSELGCGVRLFYRKLKQITDKTPADIIREYRLAIVEKLLFTTNLSIDEIMNKAGFTNRSSFYKLFSQKYGLPPRQYREKNKNQFREETLNQSIIESP